MCAADPSNPHVKAGGNPAEPANADKSAPRRHKTKKTAFAYLGVREGRCYLQPILVPYFGGVTSHNLIVLSLLPVAAVCPSGAKITQVTPSVCPSKLASCLPV